MLPGVPKISALMSPFQNGSEIYRAHMLTPGFSHYHRPNQLTKTLTKQKLYAILQKTLIMRITIGNRAHQE